MLDNRKFNKLSKISFILVAISYAIVLLIGGLFIVIAIILNIIGLIMAIGSNFEIDKSIEKGGKLNKITIGLSILLFIIIRSIIMNTSIHDSW